MRRREPRLVMAMGVLGLIGACNSLIGLDDLSVDSSPDASAGSGGSSGSDAAADGYVGECDTNQECTERATQAAGGSGTDGGIVPAVCLRPEERCVTLTSEDCQTVIGDYSNDRAIVIGSLFGFTGPQASVNLARQRAATLALEQINGPRTSGVLTGTNGDSRPLVMVACNTDVDKRRAARHLVDDLRVPAIVGPNTSQDTIDVALEVTSPKGTAVITPSAIAGDIEGLHRGGLTWLMLPSDVQRGPLMMNQINALEAGIKLERTELTTVKLGIVYRNDALGKGTNTSLSTLTLNGRSLAQNLGSSVRVDPYAGTSPQLEAKLDELAGAYANDFLPEIIVLAGTAEVVTQFMVPLENAWNEAAKPRPYYVLIDPAKVPNLTAAIQNASVPKPDDLRRRVRGVGTAAAELLGQFEVAYNTRYHSGQPNPEPRASGVGPSYDATYAIAYALAAMHDQALTGASVGEGLRRLAGGPTQINVGETTLLTAFQRLNAGERITARGTFGPLSWTSTGAPAEGRLEVWCVAPAAGAAGPRYESSGLEWDLKTQRAVGLLDRARCGWD